MTRKMMWAAIPLTMMAMTTMTGCSSDEDGQEPEPAPVVEMTRSEQEMVNHNNEFAFSLFREAQDPAKSQILSPISITYALGMLNNGAAGETQAQINKVLGFSNLSADDINAFCRKMLKTAPTLDSRTKVLIANNIYMNKGYELKADFKQKAKTFYDAEPETRNFADGKTRDVINKWGSDHTEKMIPEVLKEGEFDPGAVSYLLNAIYFKGDWAEKFNKDNTKNETFTKENNTKKSVPMMCQYHEFSYTQTNECQALCLPYGNGSFSMTILLPMDGKTITDVAQTLTAEKWKNIMQNMRGCPVDLKLPRFESDTDIDLRPIMAKLGMPDAFDGNKADFSNFCNVCTYIGLMKQVAKIKVNEEGTEAAAVTVVGKLAASPGGSESFYITFHANHPFLYVISERQTGAIFFIGQYTGN